MIPEYPVWTIERKAAEILRDAYPVGIPESFIDIEWVIEEPLGLEIVPIPGILDGWGIPGAFCRHGRGRFCIIVDQEVMDSRPNYYRFTLGEELSHYVLHRKHLPAVASHDEAIKVYRRLNEWPFLHRNARRFAAAILVPMRTLVPNAGTAYAELVRTAGFGDPDAIHKYLASRLAAMYQVSSEAMRYRLKEYPERLEERVTKALQEKLESLP